MNYSQALPLIKNLSQGNHVKNVPIVGNFLVVIAAFGLVSLSVAIYVGFQIQQIDIRRCARDKISGMGKSPDLRSHL